MPRPGLRRSAPWALAALAALVGVGAWAGAAAPAGTQVGHVAASTVRSATSGLTGERTLPPIAFDRIVEAVGDRPGPARVGGPDGVLATATVVALAALGCTRRTSGARVARGLRCGRRATRAPPALG